MIFFAETAVRDSRTRQTMTAIAPAIELISDITLRGGVLMKIKLPNGGQTESSSGLPGAPNKGSVLSSHFTASRAATSHGASDCENLFRRFRQTCASGLRMVGFCDLTFRLWWRGD